MTDDRLIPALLELAKAGIPTDTQELLVSGNPMRGIAPGALNKAIDAALSAPAMAGTVAAEPAGLEKRPVAFRVKDFADGWILFHDEEKALAEADETGAVMQGLYVRDGAAPQAPGMAALEDENRRLRAVVSKICEGLPNGAYCSPQCSIEFMEQVPNEVSLVVAWLSAPAAFAPVRAPGAPQAPAAAAPASPPAFEAVRVKAQEDERDRLLEQARKEGEEANPSGQYRPCDYAANWLLAHGAMMPHFRAARRALSGDPSPTGDGNG